MSKVKIQGNASGTGVFTVAAPATNTDRTITLPDVDATVLTTAGGNVAGELTLSHADEAGLKFKSTGTDGVTAAKILFEDTAGGVGGILRFDHDDNSFKFSTAGDTERMKIDSSGRVTTPYNPAFHAYRSSNPGVQTSLTGPLVFDVAKFNNGNYYNTSTGYFTAPVNGNYCFSVSTNMSGEQNPRQFAFYRNGSIYVRIYGDLSGSWLPTSMTHTIQLNANDTIGVWYTSRTDYGADWCNFSGHLIG